MPNDLTAFDLPHMQRGNIVLKDQVLLTMIPLDMITKIVTHGSGTALNNVMS